MNGLTLAYLGDSYYELKIRQHIINKGITNVDILHKQAIRFVCATAQASILAYLLQQNLLSEVEIAIYKRARNAVNNPKRAIDPQIYGLATGFEAIIGYLFNTDLQRCDKIVMLSITYIEEREL